MYFYSPTFLKKVRAICSQFKVPLIADEIATGLGRTGKLFACDHAGIEPDIMCLGKTLSAGYITLAATLCSSEIANTICHAEPGVFMHGPTFMGNPLACAVASKSIELLTKSDWQKNVLKIEHTLKSELEKCNTLPGVVDVRALGSIGVVELDRAVNLAEFQPICVKKGIWLRPFGKLVYMMPPYTITPSELTTLCEATYSALKQWLS